MRRIVTPNTTFVGEAGQNRIRPARKGARITCGRFGVAWGNIHLTGQLFSKRMPHIASSETGMSSTTPNPLGQSEARGLLQRYAEVCNRAIARNSHKTWFRKAKEASKLLVGGSKFRTLVYEGDPDNIVAEATLQFDARQETVRVLDGNDQDAAFTWKVSTSYLRDVADVRPDWYTANPLRLDWKWLSERAGDEWRHRETEPLALGFLAGLAFATIMSVLRPRDRYRY